MTRYLIVFASFFTFSCNLFGQQLRVYINEDSIINYSTYAFYPNYFRFKIRDKSIDYKIKSGQLSIYDKSGKSIKYKTSIDSNFLDGRAIAEFMYPEYKIIIDIKSIQNTRTGVISNFNTSFAIKLSTHLTFKENPLFDLLLNESVLYKTEGIQFDSIKTITIIPGKEYFNDKIEITYARGGRLVGSYWITMDTFIRTKGSDIFKYGIQGDRFVITFFNKNTQLPNSVVIPVK
jgi:hypothetical protein